ncbi:MAG: hypothetical protein XD48_2178 [Archaeoglobus fulgidus]|jgi:hypothetical protein|uniref:Uncharacterized protein n=1 Tax=Archaeoglobus fulgidus TaxID=2234 RepID=A0A101DZC8_ARCFL|nr:MAG: hypothetical protein XD48_2178 [Archaeoglobus fulgidus]
MTSITKKRMVANISGGSRSTKICRDPQRSRKKAERGLTRGDLLVGATQLFIIEFFGNASGNFSLSFLPFSRTLPASKS